MFWSLSGSSLREAAEQSFQLFDTYIELPGFSAEDSDHNSPSSSIYQTDVGGLNPHSAHHDGACLAVVVVHCWVFPTAEETTEDLPLRRMHPYDLHLSHALSATFPIPQFSGPVHTTGIVPSQVRR